MKTLSFPLSLSVYYGPIESGVTQPLPLTIGHSSASGLERKSRKAVRGNIRIILLAVVASLTVFAAIVALSIAARETMLIEPLKGVGKIRAGMTGRDVVALLGQPDPGPKGMLSYRYSKRGVTVHVNKQDVVDNVVCGLSGDFFRTDTPFRGHTKEGIGIGSSRAEVIKVLGEPTTVSSIHPGMEGLKYSEKGLVLQLQDGKVSWMFVAFHPLPK